MARTLPTGARAALYAQETGAMFPVLIEIEHEATEYVLRICNNSEALTYDGDEYAPYPFRFEFHTNEAGAPATARITISNVTQEIAAALQGLTTPPVIRARAMYYEGETFEPIMAPEYTLRSISIDAHTISGVLSLDEWAENDFPGDDLSPMTCPGIHV